MSPAVCERCGGSVPAVTLDGRGRCPACAPCAVCPPCAEVHQPVDGPCPCRDGELDRDELDRVADETGEATRDELDTPIADLLLAPDLVPWPEGAALPWESGWTPAGVAHAEAA